MKVTVTDIVVLAHHGAITVYLETWPHEFELETREAADLGTRNLLAIMRKYSTSVEAIQLGCWMLSTQALKDQGFSRASVRFSLISAVGGVSRFAPLFFH